MDYQRRLIIDNDGGDTFYCAGPSYAQFIAARMQGLSNTGATTIFYTPVSSGFSVFTHHTRIGSVRTEHEARHPRNITAELLARGTDCLQYAIRFCREQCMELFFGMRMNDTHDGTGAPYSEAMLRGNRFKRENPQCLLGTRERPPRYGAWTAVNYLCAPVRDMAYALIAEVCQNYDVDGIYLDFFRHPIFFPGPANGEPAGSDALTAMTGLLQRIKDLLNKETKRRGKTLPLAIRVPDSVPYARFLGLDLEKWLADGLVDILLTSSYLQMNPWEVSVALGHKAGIPVYASLDETRIRDLEANRLRTEPPGMYARCANALSAGCDGVMLFNYIFDDVRNAAERYELIRDVAIPERLRLAPKRYFSSFLGLGAVAGGAPDHSSYQSLPVLSPDQPLCIDGIAEIQIQVGDPYMKRGKLLLWLDAPVIVSLWLNGVALGQAIGTYAELTIQQPLQGINRLRVQTTERVRLLDAAIELTNRE